MATVLERFNKLGLASSNSVLSAAGAWVSDAFKKDFKYPWQERSLVNQIEPDGKEYEVFNYPEYWSPIMDMSILKFVNQTEPVQIARPKRKRIHGA